MAEERSQQRLAAILAADVVGYSRLMGADEVGTHLALKAHRKELIAPKEAQYHGRTIKLMGDGALMEFGSVVEAVQFALDVQRGMRKRNAGVPEDQRIVYRIGINLGDIIVDGDDVYGYGVNVAARLEALAPPGGICVRRNVRDEVRDKLDIQFEDLGDVAVKNIVRPVRCFAVMLDDGGEEEQAVLPQHGNATTLALPEKPSIAVLPFQNMSGDPEQEFFADGMAEDIITALSRHRSLFVIARNSTFAYKGQSPDLRQVAADLGVRYVLEGSVRKGGNRVRLTAQLIDGASGNHLWAERYDRTLDDIFAVQDEMTQEITARIGPEIDQAERDRARLLPPENLDVWERYQRGLWHMYRFNAEDNAEAQRLFRSAIEASDTFAPAHAGLAHALYYAFMHGHARNRQETLDEAYASARAAVTADERDADAHFALGRVLYLRRNLSASLKEFEAAISQNPNFAHAYLGYGTALAFDGQPERCIEASDQAARLSPHDPVMWTMLGVKALGLIGMEKYTEAVEAAREAVRQPTAPWTIYAIFAGALGLAGDTAEGAAAIAEARRRLPDVSESDVRQVLPFREAADIDRLVDGLRRSGLAD